jgi:hypothetical protein
MLLGMLTHARRLYEAGATFSALADQIHMPASTLKGLFRSLGFPVRPRGRVPRPARTAYERRHATARPAVQVAPDARGRLRIPCRSREERSVRAWTSAELRAIEVEIAARRVQWVRRGRSGLPEPTRATWQAAGIAFVMAMRRLRAAA